MKQQGVFMDTSILQQFSTAVQNLLPKSEANTQASNATVPPPNTALIPIPREVVESLSSSRPEIPQTATPVTTMTPKEISDARLVTQELNPEFLKKIAADLQPTLLKPTGSKEEQITNLTNLITDVLAGKEPAIPEFKHDKVLDLSSKKPAESFFERVIARYHTEATNKDNYSRNLPPEELTKLVKTNLEPLVGLAVKLKNTNLTAQVSNLLSEDFNTNKRYVFFTPHSNNFAKSISAASDDVFIQLVTKDPKFLLEAMLDNNPKERSYSVSPEGIARAVLGVSDEGFKSILESLKSQPDSLVKALVNITSKERNPLVGYGVDDLTKGTQARLSQILEAVKPLETKLTEASAVAQFSQDKAQVINYLTKVVNHGKVA
ncbi:MAG: hypothetical protein KGO93_06050 [Cyanobacteria bacterium REEB446]|nr:hypothetical protein [Cyanobacteria bacterium REEB446]